MNSKQANKALKGKTIKRVEMGSYWDKEYRVYIHNPRIEFTDGTVLLFLSENSSDANGVDFLIPKRTQVAQ